MQFQYGISLAVELACCYIAVGNRRQGTLSLESACSMAKAGDDSDSQFYCEKLLQSLPNTTVSP